MKAGRSLQDLAAELDRQAKSKKDYVADTRKLKMRVNGGQKTEAGHWGLVLDGVNGGMPLRDAAHGQLSSALSIPKPYYDRMLADAPDLLASNVNHWFERQPAKKLVRTLDGQVRAILSDHFRPLDNIDLAQAVFPKLSELKAEVLSGDITEHRFYVKAVTARIAGKVVKGDVVQAGLVISNSEIGQGSLRIEALDYRLVCLNGMIREQAIRKAHLGRGARGHDAIEDAREFYRTETKIADDRAFFLKVGDSVAGMFDEKKFADRLKQYQDAAGWKIDKADEVADVVEVIVEQYKLSEVEGKSVLGHLIKGGDLSQWGVANAVTRASQDADSYDRATELEVIGGKLIDVGKWV